MAQEYGVAIDYRPVDLPKVYERTGGILLGQRSGQRQDYRIAELKRWRRRLGIPLNIEPKYFPVNHDPASRLITAAKRAGLPLGKLTFAIMRGMWAEERDISDEGDAARDRGTARSGYRRAARSVDGARRSVRIRTLHGSGAGRRRVRLTVLSLRR